MRTPGSILRNSVLGALLVFAFEAAAQDAAVTSGATYLKNQQKQDGSWSDKPRQLFDTVEAANTLKVTGQFPESFSSAVEFVAGFQAKGTDATARKLLVLALGGKELSATKSELLAKQQAGGGWGSERGQRGTPIDTAIALRGLIHPVTFDAASYRAAVDDLVLRQLASGAWALQEGGPGNLFVTALAVAFIAEYDARHNVASPQVTAAIRKGAAFIVSQQNADGSFGTLDAIVVTSWCIMALVRSTQPASALDSAVTFLKGQQLSNGSWDNDVHKTALATRAIFERQNPPVPAPADLVVTGLSFAPAAAKAGEPIFLTATVKNQGGRPAAGVSVAFFDGSSALGNGVDVGTLLPGASVPITITVTLSSGLHNITAKVDPGDRVLESNEANNSATTSLSVAANGLADLAVGPSSVVIQPAMPIQGQPVSIKVTVSNVGTAPAKNAVVRVFHGDPASGGRPIGEDVVIPTIEAGQSASRTMLATLKAGSHNIFVVADPGGLIAESSELNNKASASVTVAPSGAALPDLLVAPSEIVCAPSPAAAGQEVAISATVRNVGAAYAGVPVTIRVLDGDRQIGGPLQISGLASGGVATVSVTASFHAGVHEITVEVDGRDALLESSEENNRASKQLLVTDGPLADLVASDVQASKLSLKNGEPVTLSVKVQNTGARAAKGFAVQFFDETPVGGARIGPAFTVTSLEPGASTVVAISVVLPVGKHTIFARADALDVIAETSEGDNLAKGPKVTVSAEPFTDPLSFSSRGTEFVVAVPNVNGVVTLVLTADEATTFTISGALVAAGTVSPDAPQTFDVTALKTFPTVDPQSGKSFTIMSAKPIGVQLFHEGFGEVLDGVLVHPASAGGTTYRVSGFGGPGTSPGTNGVMLIGLEDGATVTVAGPPGSGITPPSKTLNKGDTWVLTAGVDITGLTATGTKKFAVQVFAHSALMPHPTVSQFGHPWEQEIPVEFWGQSFAVAPKVVPTLFDFVRVLAHFDGTVVTIKQSAKPDSVVTLNAGEFFDVRMTTPARITATKPVQLTQYASRGSQPAMSKVIPEAGYADSYRVHLRPTTTLSARYGIVYVPHDGTTITLNGTTIKNGFDILPAGRRYSYQVLTDEAFGGVSATQRALGSTRPFGFVVVNEVTDAGIFPGGFFFSQRPDLFPDRVTLSQDVALQGEPVTVSAVIKNLSFADSAGFEIHFFDGDPASGGVFIGSVSLTGLKREEEKTVSVPWIPASSGSRTIFVIVDPLGTIFETREANNVTTLAVNVRSRTDLSSSLTLNKTEFFANQDVNIAALVNNLASTLAGTLKDGKLEITIEDASGNKVATVIEMVMPELAAIPEGFGSWHFFVDAKVTPSVTRQNQAIVRVPVNFTKLLEALGVKGRFDENSLRVFEMVGVSFRERPSYFVKDATFVADANALGVVEWVTPGPLMAGATRTYRIFFDILENGAKAPVERIFEPTVAQSNDFNEAAKLSLVLSDRQGGFSVLPVTGVPFVGYPFRTVDSATPLRLPEGDFYSILRMNKETAFPPLNKLGFIIRSNGSNLFTAETPAILGRRGFLLDLAVGDLNGDGLDDVVVFQTADDRSPGAPAVAGNRTIAQVYLGRRGDGYELVHELVVRKVPDFASFDLGRRIGLADVDGDGKIDLVATFADFFSNPLSVFKGNGDGTFASTPIDTTYTPDVYSSSFVLGDFNEDGKVDVVFVKDASGAFFAAGTGTGTFGAATFIPDSPGLFGVYEPNAAMSNISALDFNRDGHLDLVFPENPGPFSLRVVRGDGTGKFANPTSVALSHRVRAARSIASNIVQGSAHDKATALGFSGTFAFGTGATLPGPYNVVLTIRDMDGNVVHVNKTPFTILSAIDATSPAAITKSRVITDQKSYEPAQTVTITSSASNISINTVLTGLTLKVAVVFDGGTLFTDERTGVSIAPQTTFSFGSFFTLPPGQAPGSYTVKLRVLQAGTEISSAQTEFMVLPVVKFTGTLTPVPAQVSTDASFDANFTIKSLGNTTVTGVRRLRVVETLMGSALKTVDAPIAIGPGATVPGTFAGVSTAGIPPGTYLLSLSVISDAGDEFPVATASLKVTAPACPYLNFALFSVEQLKMSGQSQTNDVAISNKGHVHSKTGILLEGSARVNGNASSEEPLGSIKEKGQAQITGTQSTSVTPIAAPVVDGLVDTAAITNDNATIPPTAKGKSAIAPDGSLTLAANDSVTLSSGVYFFTAIKLAGGSEVKITGTARIFVSGTIDVAGSAKINAGESAGKLLVVTKTTATVRIASEVKMSVALVAPKASVTLVGSTEIRGAIVGKKVDVQGSVKILHDPSVQDLCGFLGS